MAEIPPAPAFKDILAARRRIAPYVPRTPLHHYAALSKLLGCEVRLKHENHHALGAFKVRGGINLLSQLSDVEKSRGLVTASSGNHGQSIAYACSVFGVRAVICLPEGANPLKVESMRNLGAEVVFHGSEFDEARAHSERLSQEEGYLYVHPANEPRLVEGVGTASLEIMEDWPDVDVILVPLGGGSGASGACIVTKAIAPNVRVIAVQSAQAPAGYLSWKERRIIDSPMKTRAEGLATATAYEMTQSILWELLDDFILVSDDEIDNAIRVLLEKAHTLAEGAGAAATAGAIKLADQLQGKRVAVIVSGGNITPDQVRGVLGG